MLAKPGGSSLPHDRNDPCGFKLTDSLESLALFLCKGGWCGCRGWGGQGEVSGEGCAVSL